MILYNLLISFSEKKLMGLKYRFNIKLASKMFIDIVGKALKVTLRRDGKGRYSFRIVSPFYASTLLCISSKDLLRFKCFAKMLLTLSHRLCRANSQTFFRCEEMIIRRVINEMIRIYNDIALMIFQSNNVERVAITCFKTLKCSGMYHFYQEIIDDFLSILRSQITAEIIKFSCVLGMPSSAVLSLIQRLPHNPAKQFLGISMEAEVQQFMCSLMQGRSPAEWKSKFDRNLRLYARPFMHLLRIAYPGTAGGGAADGTAAGGAADGTAAGGAAGGGTAGGAGGGAGGASIDSEESQAMYE